MFRKIRITVAALFLIGITLLLIGIGRDWLAWMASLQFLPSLLALNIPVMVGILLLTFLFGRLYCSIICPLGVFQDIVLWMRRSYGSIRSKLQARRLRRLKAAGKPLPKPKKFSMDFRYRKENRWLRLIILGLCIIGQVASVQFLLTLLAPYSAYGRFVRSIVGLAEGDSMVPALLIVAGVTFVLVTVLAWTGGRTWCNNICPVGSVLSLVSRFAIFRPVIDKSKCTACKKCERNCKSSCIDIKNHKIDTANCVMCFDCIENCNDGAISIGRAKAQAVPAEVNTPESQSRRNFLGASAVLIGGSVLANAQSKHLDGGLAEVIDKQTPPRQKRIVPPGAVSHRHLAKHCTACQLCVSSCPNGVLRTSRDLGCFLQPEMGYEKGYCRPECTACADVCPTDAIRPLERYEKLNIRIGTARMNPELCFAATGKENCGNCALHCPSGAIRMVEAEGYPKPIPVVNEEQCTGCGACEFLCPSRPVSAIVVDGLSTHIDKFAS